VVVVVVVVVVVGGGTVEVVVVVGGSVVPVTSRTGASAMTTGTGWCRPDVGRVAGPVALPDTGRSGAAEASPLPCRATRGTTSRAAQSTNATA